MLRSLSRVALVVVISIIVTGCKLALTVTSGGDVQSLSGTNDCAGGSLCEFDIVDTDFNEMFTAVARDGYVFSKWQGGTGYLCADSADPVCGVSNVLVAGNVTADAIIATGKFFYAKPLFEFVGIDTDGDGVKNHIDDDNDNDGVLDADDICPLDVNDNCVEVHLAMDSLPSTQGWVWEGGGNPEGEIASIIFDYLHIDSTSFITTAQHEYYTPTFDSFTIEFSIKTLGLVGNCYFGIAVTSLSGLDLSGPRFSLCESGAGGTIVRAGGVTIATNLVHSDDFHTYRVEGSISSGEYTIQRDNSYIGKFPLFSYPLSYPWRNPRFVFGESSSTSEGNYLIKGVCFATNGEDCSLSP